MFAQLIAPLSWIVLKIFIFAFVFHGKYERNTAGDSANDYLIERRQFNLVYEGFCLMVQYGNWMGREQIGGCNLLIN